MRSKQNVSAARVRKFQKKILSYYKAHGRDLPWRHTSDPYEIMVSELMLQQTQAPRVIAKYKSFLKKFKTVEKLAKASTKDVITAWQGLGYNRRALYLKRSAEIIVEKYGGVVPREVEKLQELPGIGPYTARAILAFAFNRKAAFIETNIRSVYIHEFFSDAEKVHDSEILKLVEQTLPQKNFRAWFSALMDYGAMLKQNKINPSRKSASYLKQKPFKGSNRQKRGEILRLIIDKPRTKGELERLLKSDSVDLLEALQKEGFIKLQKGKYAVVV